MNDSTSATSKKAVLIRVPFSMYNDLLNLSAAATLLQRRSVSVPSLILELLQQNLDAKRPNSKNQ